METGRLHDGLSALTQADFEGFSKSAKHDGRMTPSGANFSPKANFRAIREKYREFPIFEVDPGTGSAQSRRDHCAF